MSHSLIRELAVPIALGCGVVGVPIGLERLLPPSHAKLPRLIEALALAAVMATAAHGLIGDAGGRAAALAVIIFSVLRIRRNPISTVATDSTDSTRDARAPGDPLLTIAALGVCALVRPVGPTVLFHGWGILTVGLFLYWSSSLRILANAMALFVLLWTAVSLFT